MPHTFHLFIHTRSVFTNLFYYPNGLTYRSVWQPRDATQYIRQWYQLASMPATVLPHGAATEHANELSKAQVTQLFRAYMDDMKKTLRPEQKGKAWTYYNMLC